MYEDDSSSVEGGPKSSFEVYKAEGDVLFKHGDYRKAILSYNTALEQKPDDRNCLVARSQCYLQLGESEKALADAEATLQENKEFIKGIYQKAEALYQKGDFEFALVYFHRGNKLRPEVKGFRLGIQKAQEAIDNSIGDIANIRLENKGDLEYFYQLEEKNQKRKTGYSRAMVRKESGKKRGDRPKSTVKDQKTCKQLLGELYADKEYLEKLLQDTESNSRSSDTNQEISRLAREGLEYLDTRTEFWQQQRPMYSRKRDKAIRDSARGSGKQNVGSRAVRDLEKIENAQEEGRWEDSLKMSKKCLRQVENSSDDDVPNRPEIIASLHSYLGNAYLELEEFGKSLDHHEKDKEIADQCDIPDAKSRAMDNLGRVYARMGKFEKAVEIWEEKLPLSKSPLESTWLYHEIGRCHLELEHYKEAQGYGEKSLAAAEEANDDVWKINASVLVAQSYVKLDEFQLALDSFESALEMAKLQEDKKAETAIKKAIDEVNSRIVKGMKDRDTEDDQRSHKSDKDDAYSQHSDQQDNQYEDDFEDDQPTQTETEEEPVIVEVKSDTEDQEQVGSTREEAAEERIEMVTVEPVRTGVIPVPPVPPEENGVASSFTAADEPVDTTITQQSTSQPRKRPAPEKDKKDSDKDRKSPRGEEQVEERLDDKTDEETEQKKK